MIFPLHINYTFKLSNETEHLNTTAILSIIKDRFKQLKVDEFIDDADTVKFKNRLFNGQGRYHIFAPIDSGYFEYDNHHNKVTITFSTKRMVLIVLIISLFLGIISQSPLFALTSFLWIYGMNIIIFLIRAKFLIKKIKKETEKIIDSGIVEKSSAS